MISPIKFADKICRVLGKELPHISTTKIDLFVENMQARNLKAANDYIQTPQMDHYLLRKYASNEDKKVFNILDWYKNKISQMNRVRDNSRAYMDGNNDANIVLHQFKYQKLGNCQEDGLSAETICKMNGIKNANTASLERGGMPIKHSVCVFNKDGSAFNGNIINNETIIIDPWLGKVDFANSYFAKNEGILRERLFVPREGKFGFREILDHKFTPEELTSLKKDFPTLVLQKK